MRDDQRQRLADISEALAEVAIRDADPANWTAADKPLCDMTKEERGDAAWCRKTAVQSVALLGRLQQILRDTGGGKSGDDDDPASDIKRAEKEARKLLERVGVRADGNA
ncbi:hypothetical protein [Stenotrophomonas maltophilia]|uniref:hypothetical protein n=1 Tax=Stenotrophomonas maltophilia TaxID=40324 RepID=UPI000DA9ADE6|nr:hypothetical protein [Stenotrophomonas maltophilia]MBN5096048.1 hypothetical protein [Stenotrophomonas maltophilia]PZS74592.1 hypothetical protein A7X75_04430 [Stenotrophomonas maltophilia]QDY47307.1 hypothetical protein DUW70_01510 [Stenotrophomonas maltophilia]HDS1602775.1 hypothetical protein [Stenotrophomonas maltophilia]HEL5316874.1 hypothetical protein [Stenotrophomonas maltophilia]